MSVWLFLGSPRFAIYLLLILAAAAVLGTAIPQGRPPGAPEPSGLVGVFQLHDVYHAWWFAALLWLISINLAISSARRGRRVWRQTRHPEVLVGAERVAAMRDSATWEVPTTVEYAEGRAGSALRRLGYRVRRAQAAGAIGVHAQRGTLGAWGSFVSHVSMLIIFAGAGYGRLPTVGFDVVASIAEGGEYRIPETDISVALKRTDIILDKQGHISQYESDLEISRDGKRVARKTISVNHPLSYAGYNMYQTTWGTEVQPGEIAAGEAGFDLVVRPGQGESYRVPVWLPLEEPELQEIGVTGKRVSIEPVRWRVLLQGFDPRVIVENEKRQRLPARIENVYVLPAGEHASGAPHEMPEHLGAIEEGRPVVHEGVTLSLDNVRIRSGIEIRRDPGVPIVWVGCGLLVVGLFLTFYIWPRTVRVHISPSGDGASVVAGAAGRGDSRAAADLRRLERVLRGGDGTQMGRDG